MSLKTALIFFYAVGVSFSYAESNKALQNKTAVNLPVVNINTPTWKADNGNSTFTNPLFYDEFFDPDLIRVDDDYYLTGTTMHAMPGLPILHSKDLVNWEFLTYACPKLDFGPAYRLQEGKDIYGQGIWAPTIRYHNGTFYNGFVTVEGAGGMAQVRIIKEASGEASLFQWQDMLKGDLMLHSLATPKYLFADPGAGSLCSADAAGTRPDRKDGACF